MFAKKMKLTFVTVTIFILHLCWTMSAINGQRFADHPLATHTTVMSRVGYRDRRNKAEPTCEELRAMWRYSKRQSRAAEVTNDLPMYRDPFAYNIWETYPIRSQSTLRDDRDDQARNRGGGRAPVYGKMIHKAPAEGRLRNGMPHRLKAFEEVAKLYGTVNRQPPDSRRPPYSLRIGGGSSHVPQAGSFQHLKELIRTERARELQEQRIAEEIAARASAINEISRKGRRSSDTQYQRNYPNSIQSYEEPMDVIYNFPPPQYVPSITSFSDDLMRNDDYEGNPMLH